MIQFGIRSRAKNPTPTPSVTNPTPPKNLRLRNPPLHCLRLRLSQDLGQQLTSPRFVEPTLVKVAEIWTRATAGAMFLVAQVTLARTSMMLGSAFCFILNIRFHVT